MNYPDYLDTAAEALQAEHDVYELVVLAAILLARAGATHQEQLEEWTGPLDGPIRDVISADAQRLLSLSTLVKHQADGMEHLG